MKNTMIEWCDSTVNPVMGCQGCELWSSKNKTCYAGMLTERHYLRRAGKIAKDEDYNPEEGEDGWPEKFEIPMRFQGRMMEAANWSDLRGRKHSFIKTYKKNGKKIRVKIRKPALDGLPRCIFVSDMGDALSLIKKDLRKRKAEQEQLFQFLKREILPAVLSENGQRHIWMWLTKQPQRMADFSGWLKDQGISWPQNLWAMTSVTRQATAGVRIPALLEVGDETTTRGLSVEPLWEEVTLSPWIEKLDWVIVGGESGPKRRVMDLAWAKKLLDECEGAKVPFFLKQIGGPSMDKGGDITTFPVGLQIRELPRKTRKEQIKGAGKTYRQSWERVPIARDLAAQLDELAKAQGINRRDYLNKLLRKNLPK